VAGLFVRLASKYPFPIILPFLGLFGALNQILVNITTAFLGFLPSGLALYQQKGRCKRMDIPKVVSWIGDSDFEKQNPIVGKITAIEEGKNKWGKPEFELHLGMENGNIRQISLFGDNRNNLVDKFGTDSTAWIGKSVQVTQLTDLAGKKIKQIKGL
jgi:hypothetical protein